jgi:hypothetical protein
MSSPAVSQGRSPTCWAWPVLSTVSVRLVVIACPIELGVKVWRGPGESGPKDLQGIRRDMPAFRHAVEFRQSRFDRRSVCEPAYLRKHPSHLVQGVPLMLAVSRRAALGWRALLCASIALAAVMPATAWGADGSAPAELKPGQSTFWKGPPVASGDVEDPAL